MNQGRIWCVVNPSVGLPLFIGGVAVTSLVVHAAIMTHTPWMSSYWTGAAKPKTAMNGEAAPATSSPAAFVITVAPAPAGGKTDTAYTVTVSPNPAASADGAARPSNALALATPTSN